MKTFSSLICKRCSHAQSEWELCSHHWFFHITHGLAIVQDGPRKGKTTPRKYRGTIPNATTYVAAKAAYAQIVANVKAGRAALDGFAQPTEGYTLASLGEEWLSVARDRKASGIASHRGHLRTHVNPVLGPILVTALTHEDCDRFVRAMAAKTHLSPATKMSAAITLSALMTFAVKKKRLRTDNPALGLSSELRNPNAPKHARLDSSDYFTQDEAPHLLATCREQFPEWYALVLLGLSTGLRLGEMLGLKWGAINWRGSFIHVSEAWVKGEWTSPKNRSPRDVKMTPQLRAELRLRRMKRANRTDSLVFPSEAGTPMEHSNLRRRLWTPLLTRAGLHHRKMHAMRHTYASLNLQQGANVAWVQKQLGHRSMDITVNTYSHFMPSAATGEAERLGDLLQPRTQSECLGSAREALKRRVGATNLRVAVAK